MILLFGMPRSGTTWIGKIFDSHPDTLYRHEPDSWGLLDDIPLLATATDFEFYRATFEPFVSRLHTMRHTKVSASLPAFPKSYYSATTFAMRKIALFGTKVVAKAIGELPVPDFVDYRKQPQVRMVWKSIGSLGRLGVIARLLPQRHAIHILRHPCGYVASVLSGEAKGKFEAGEPSSEDFGIFRMISETSQGRNHGLSLDTFKNMQPVERLAWCWVIFNEKAMDDTAGLSGVTTLRYEDLCADPLGVARQLFDFAGLSWNSQTDAFLQSSVSKNNDSYYSVFKNPLKSANKWRSQLPADQASRILSVVEKSRLGSIFPG